MFEKLTEKDWQSLTDERKVSICSAIANNYIAAGDLDRVEGTVIVTGEIVKVWEDKIFCVGSFTSLGLADSHNEFEFDKENIRGIYEDQNGSTVIILL